jgi:2-aminoadipate transaminase
MLATLAEELGGFDEQVTWTQPVGGLYVWVRLPTWLATGPGSDFSQRCKTEAVLVVPGEYCYPSDMAEIPRHYVRLSFAAQPIERIREGVRRFAAVVQTLMRRH